VLRQALYPEAGRLVAAGNAADAVSLARSIAGVVAFLSVGAMIVLIVTGKQLLAIVFGPEYVEAHMVLVVLFAGVAIFTIASPYAAVVQLTRGSLVTFRYNVISFAAFAVITPLSLQWAQLQGAGWGSLAFDLLYSTLVVAGARRLTTPRSLDSAERTTEYQHDG
jgi:O-antigen/teichoic acid export membrane protein